MRIDKFIDSVLCLIQRFVRKSLLINGISNLMLTHTKVKYHECDICKKTFSLKGNLVKQFRIHLREKPHGCSKSKKWFTHVSTRNKHLRTHKELCKEQQSEPKCAIPRSIVHDWLV